MSQPSPASATAITPEGSMFRPAADPRRAVVRRASVVVASLAALTGTGAILLWLGRGTTFFYDEWNFVERRRTGVIRPLLEGHNGHLSAGPVIVYRVLFATAGLRHYAPYRLTLIGLHLLCAVLVFVLVRGRLGTPSASIAAIALLWYG